MKVTVRCKWATTNRRIKENKRNVWNVSRKLGDVLRWRTLFYLSCWNGGGGGESFLTDKFSSTMSLHKERLSRGRIFSVRRRIRIVSNWRQFIWKIYCGGWPHITADQRWIFLFISLEFIRLMKNASGDVSFITGGRLQDSAPSYLSFSSCSALEIMFSTRPSLP